MMTILMQFISNSVLSSSTAAVVIANVPVCQTRILLRLTVFSDETCYML